MRITHRRAAGAVALSALLTGGLAALALIGPARAVDAEQSAAGAWTIDPVHSSCVFRVRHAGATNFYGAFRDLKANFTLDEESPANSRFNATISAESVDTRNDNRNNHLRSPDFFNVRQFPEITFASKRVEAAGEGVYRVVGDLTMHGVTREIEAMVRKTGEGEFRGTRRLGVEAMLEIKRADFGMTSFLASDGGDDGMLGNTVSVIVSLEGMPG